MKHLLITTIAAVLLVGCGKSQQSTPQAETKPTEPVATAKAPDIPLWEAAMNGNIEVVKQHLAAGADVNTKGGWKEGTPLHYAANKEIAELLIAKGADVNAKNNLGGTPLLYAAVAGHKEVAELLIAKGADVNAKDKKDYTPLDGAKNKPETAGLLRKHGGKTGAELKTEGK